MTSPLALFGRGAAGLPPPAPVEFASLVLPRSPNTCLAAPAWHPGFRHLETPHAAATPDALMQRLLGVAQGFARTERMAHWPQRCQAQWVERSALMNYPDLINVEAVAAPQGGSGLLVYSRSLFGWSDLGANRARVQRWLAALGLG